MFSSIECAARCPGWLPALTHWALVLGDQPHLRPATLQAVVELGSRHPDAVCQPARHGRRRHTVLLPKSVFLASRSSPAHDVNAFPQAYRIETCEPEDAGLDFDLDRLEDYEAARCLDDGTTPG